MNDQNTNGSKNIKFSSLNNYNSFVNNDYLKIPGLTRVLPKDFVWKGRVDRLLKFYKYQVYILNDSNFALYIDAFLNKIVWFEFEKSIKEPYELFYKKKVDLEYILDNCNSSSIEHLLYNLDIFKNSKKIK